MSILIAAFLAMQAVAPAQPSGIFDGKSFLRQCVKPTSDSSFNDVFQYGICVGYVQGFWQSEQVTQVNLQQAKINDTRRSKFCIPMGISTDRMIQVVRQELQDRPQYLDDAVSVIAAGALHRAFPCAE